MATLAFPFHEEELIPSYFLWIDDGFDFYPSIPY